jgi:hypothetical protein
VLYRIEIEKSDVQQMCHLVRDPSNDVQKMAYQMLRAAAVKRTEHIVVEAGVDVEGTYEPKLPAELLEILSTQIDVEEDHPTVIRVCALSSYADHKAGCFWISARLGIMSRSLH